MLPLARSVSAAYTRVQGLTAGMSNPVDAVASLQQPRVAVEQCALRVLGIRAAMGDIVQH